MPEPETGTPLEMQSGGWRVGRSIALELDTALTALNGYFFGADVLELGGSPQRKLPPDWLEQLPGMTGGTRSYINLLGAAAIWANVLEEADYSAATLAVRQMSSAQALERLAALGFAPPAGTSGAEALADAALQQVLAAYAGLSLEFSGPQRAAGERAALLHAAHILKDGDLAGRFWHWMDRFYYETYHAWRENRREVMEALERKALLVLGAAQRRGAAPPLDWLGARNCLNLYPAVKESILQGRQSVFFWVEPFGLVDMMAPLPGGIAVSFAQDEAMLNGFLQAAEDTARRAAALSDPTRLVILRLIRHYGMMNTEIAEFLGLARPTVSVHAKILRQAGLIHSREEGRAVKHEIDAAEVRRLFRDLERFLDLPEEP